MHGAAGDDGGAGVSEPRAGNGLWDRAPGGAGAGLGRGGAGLGLRAEPSKCGEPWS